MNHFHPCNGHSSRNCRKANGPAQRPAFRAALTLPVSDAYIFDGPLRMSSTPFGEHLKREREMRGVSLEEISAATRIGTRFLEAIENEQWDQLPGGVFNRGFIRSIARFLGLDEDSLVAEYALGTGPVERRPGCRSVAEIRGTGGHLSRPFRNSPRCRGRCRHVALLRRPDCCTIARHHGALSSTVAIPKSLPQYLTHPAPPLWPAVRQSQSTPGQPPLPLRSR